MFLIFFQSLRELFVIEKLILPKKSCGNFWNLFVQKSLILIIANVVHGGRHNLIYTFRFLHIFKVAGNKAAFCSEALPNFRNTKVQTLLKLFLFNF